MAIRALACGSPCLPTRPFLNGPLFRLEGVGQQGGGASRSSVGSCASTGRAARQAAAEWWGNSVPTGQDPTAFETRLRPSGVATVRPRAMTPRA